MAVVDAYQEAGFRKDDGNASRLLSEPVIRRRVREIQLENNAMSLLSREQALGILAEIVITPVSEVGANSPLAQEYVETMTETGTCVKVRMPSNTGQISKMPPPTGFWQVWQWSRSGGGFLGKRKITGRMQGLQLRPRLELRVPSPALCVL
jgi:hypothetical protein